MDIRLELRVEHGIDGFAVFSEEGQLLAEAPGSPTKDVLQLCAALALEDLAMRMRTGDPRLLVRVLGPTAGYCRVDVWPPDRKLN